MDIITLFFNQASAVPIHTKHNSLTFARSDLFHPTKHASVIILTIRNSQMQVEKEKRYTGDTLILH